QCLWAVSGPDVPVHVFAFEVEGYGGEPWFVVTSALDLTAAQVLAAYAARYRQEDAIRDHKQRLGMEEVRARTKAPVPRTFLVQMDEVREKRPAATRRRAAACTTMKDP